MGVIKSTSTVKGQGPSCKISSSTFSFSIRCVEEGERPRTSCHKEAKAERSSEPTAICWTPRIWNGRRDEDKNRMGAVVIAGTTVCLKRDLEMRLRPETRNIIHCDIPFPHGKKCGGDWWQSHLNVARDVECELRERLMVMEKREERRH